MDEVSINIYVAKAKYFILKDVRHSVIIGFSVFAVIISLGFLPKNRDMLQGLVITASFILLIMLLKALIDWKRSFYLIETNNFSLIAKPYTRISGTYDYYFTILTTTKAFSVTPSNTFKKSIENFTQIDFKVVAPFFQELENRSETIVVLFSSTKTLLGCFDNTGNFIANS